MSRIIKWLPPVAAAMLLAMFVAIPSARGAEDAKEGKTAKGTIEGTVLDKDGKAVEGVEVRLMKPRQRGGGGGAAPATPAPSEKPAEKPAEKAATGSPKAINLQQQRPTPIATATTDKDGKFTMKDVEVGEYMVGVRDQDKKVYGRANVKVEDGKTATVEIKCTDTPPQRGGRGGAGGGGGNSGGSAPKQ